MELEGRVALVTGAGSGMGRATAQRLAAEGMRVCAVDIDVDAARLVAEPIDALALQCDVSDAAAVDGVFEQCAEALGTLDLVHLNAGVGLRWSGDIAELDIADYRRSVGVNLDGVVFGARAAVRAMRRRPPGTPGAIIATASIAGLIGFHPDPVYTIGKHGVVGLIRAIGANLAAEGISAHALCPATTETGMIDTRTKKLLTHVGITLMPPAEIADAVVFAAKAPIETTGTCWVCQPGLAPWAFRFDEVDGPENALNVPVQARTSS